MQSLGVIDYGVYNVVGGIVSSLSTLTSSMAVSTQRWITIALSGSDDKLLEHTFSVGMTLQCAIAFVLLILFETLGLWYLHQYAVIPLERADAAFCVFQLSVLTAVLSVLSVPFHGVILAHEKMGAFAFFSIVDIVAKLCVCFVLPLARVDKLILYSALLFVIYCFNVGCICLYCCRNFKEVCCKLCFDKEMMKSMSNLALWNIVGKASFVSYSQGVILLMNYFFGPAINAAAAISGQATNYLSQLGYNVQVAANPQIIKNYACKNYDDMHKLIFRSIKFSFYLMLLFAVPLFYEANMLLHIWLGEVPAHALLFTRLSVLLTLVMPIYSVLNTAAMANGNIRTFQLITNSVLMLILPFSYFAYIQGGIPESTTIITILFYSLAIIVGALLLTRLIHWNFSQFVKEVLVPIFMVGMLSFFTPLAFFLNFTQSFWRLIGLSAFSVLSTVVIVYGLGLKGNERAFVRNKIRYALFKGKDKHLLL